MKTCSHCGRMFSGSGAGLSGVVSGLGGGGSEKGYCGQKCYKESGQAAVDGGAFKLLFILALIALVLGVAVSPGILAMHAYGKAFQKSFSVGETWGYSAAVAGTVFSAIWAVVKDLKRAGTIYGVTCAVIVVCVLVAAFGFESNILREILDGLSSR